MTRTVHPITRERHGTKKWLPFQDLGFAAHAAITPLIISEVLPAARAFPLGFLDMGGRPCLEAILGLKPDRNLFVGTNGRWLGQHLPASFRSYPFSLGQTGRTVALCVEEGSGLIRDLAVGEEGAPFFDLDGSASAPTRAMLDQLAEARKGFEITERATAAIVECGLLEPWPIRYQDEGADRRIEGVSRISETALNALAPDDLAALRDSGGLAVAYCQLFSMANLATLGQLWASHAQAAARPPAPAPARPFFVPKEDDSLKIDWATFLKE